jgi:TPR repeat protein
MFKCRTPSQAHAQQWHIDGIDVGLKQRSTLLARAALCELLVLRLMRFGGAWRVRYPKHHATCVLSRRHFLGPSRNFAEFSFQEGQRLYREQRFGEASQLWGQAAVLNHGPSHAFLSEMHIDGLLETRPWCDIIDERLRYLDNPIGSPVSRQAFALASAGAALGCAHSKGALARCFFNGFGTTGSRVSLHSAFELATFSAQSGSCIGQYVVGLACKMGGESDPQRGKAAAVRWLHLAAEQGHASAQFDLSIMYSLGDGVAKTRQRPRNGRKKHRRKDTLAANDLAH